MFAPYVRIHIFRYETEPHLFLLLAILLLRFLLFYVAVLTFVLFAPFVRVHLFSLGD